LIVSVVTDRVSWCARNVCTKATGMATTAVIPINVCQFRLYSSKAADKMSPIPRWGMVEPPGIGGGGGGGGGGGVWSMTPPRIGLV
jgi:hypothetical protein